MTLVEFHVDVGRMADALERIVFLLEKLAFPPLPADVTVRQATLEDLRYVTPEDQARMAAEQMAFSELHRVVPGSEAFERELLDFEEQQRSLHGEAWEAPDWAAAFARAARPVRESAGTAGPRREA